MKIRLTLLSTLLVFFVVESHACHDIGGNPYTCIEAFHCACNGGFGGQPLWLPPDQAGRCVVYIGAPDGEDCGCDYNPCGRGAVNSGCGKTYRYHPCKDGVCLDYPFTFECQDGLKCDLPGYNGTCCLPGAGEPCDTCGHVFACDRTCPGECVEPPPPPPPDGGGTPPPPPIDTPPPPPPPGPTTPPPPPVPPAVPPPPPIPPTPPPPPSVPCGGTICGHVYQGD